MCTSQPKLFVNTAEDVEKLTNTGCVGKTEERQKAKIEILMSQPSTARPNPDVPVSLSSLTGVHVHPVCTE